MFKNPFSFKGRIRRLEYGLSYIIYIVTLEILGLLIADFDEDYYLIAYLIVLFPCLWFLLAQGAKRCHDRGNSGFYQIIPFYSLWMLFADGEYGPNEYGPNPKGKGNIEEIEEIGKPVE